MSAAPSAGSSGHRSPASFFDQIAPLVSLGLFQRGQLRGRIGTILESVNTIRHWLVILPAFSQGSGYSPFFISLKALAKQKCLPTSHSRPRLCAHAQDLESTYQSWHIAPTASEIKGFAVPDSCPRIPPSGFGRRLLCGFDEPRAGAHNPKSGQEATMSNVEHCERVVTEAGAEAMHIRRGSNGAERLIIQTPGGLITREVPLIGDLGRDLACHHIG